ncbi:hypothetical protein JD969_08880 [Planctomycetota bacterium]|nr:hypothetical protein JD969_08880 [Planctomycetota bacterium]
MSRRLNGIWILGLLVSVLAGCHSTPLPYPMAKNPFEIDKAEYRRVYNAARKVLVEDQFQLDEQNYRYGIISTRPQASPTILEPWYGGVNSTWEQVDTSTLDQVQRVVTVRVTTGRLMRFELAKLPRYQDDESPMLQPELPDTDTVDLDVVPGPVPLEGTPIEGNIDEDAAEPLDLGETGDPYSMVDGVAIFALSMQDDRGEDVGEVSSLRTPQVMPDEMANPKTIRQIANPKLSVSKQVLDLKDDGYYLYIRVDMQRKVNTLRYLNGKISDNVFAELNEVPIEQRRRGVPAKYWETFDRDLHMEQKLLRQIIEASFNE